MGVIYIDLPESVLLATGQSQAEFVKEAKFLLALKLFELGRLSSGKAADLCALPRVDFLLLAEFGRSCPASTQTIELFIHRGARVSAPLRRGRLPGPRLSREL